jgi:hypothetical protein
MDKAIKVTENRIRRVLGRRGLRLVKSRRRDRHAIGFGRYMVVDCKTNFVEYGGGDDPELTLNEVAAWLAEGDES